MTNALRFHPDVGSDPSGTGASGRSERAVKVLLVDDRRENLVALKAVLEPLGEELVAVPSGRDALRELLRDSYAAILLDVEMPELDGFETARLIREHPRLRETPILFLTAHGHLRDFASRAYALGAVDFLVKPLEVGALTAKVRAFADLHRRRMALMETNARLQRRSKTDVLTGLLHAGILEKALRQERIRCADSGVPLCAGLIELVDLRAIRRAYGTSVGELIVRDVARLLTAAVPEPAALGRLPPDRFLVLLPGREVDAGMAVLDRVLGLLARDIAMPGGQTLQARAAAVHASHPAAEALPTRPSFERLVQALSGGLDAPGHTGLVDAPPPEVASPKTASFHAERHPIYSLDGPLVAVELRGADGPLLRAPSDLDPLGAIEQRDLALHVDLDPVMLLTANDALVATVAQLQRRNVPLTLEIAAHALSASPGRFTGALEQLRRAGARILLDDLGARPTGMEAVVRLAPDAVKLAAGVFAPLDPHHLTRRVRMLDAIGADVLFQGVDTPDAMRFVRSLAATVPIAGIQGDYPSRVQ
jgi:CheY-like chemotaxis protein